MRTETIETLIWVLIYGGLIAVGLGLAVQHAAEWLGHVLMVMGAVLVVCGVVLIWVRSRVKPGTADPEERR